MKRKKKATKYAKTTINTTNIYYYKAQESQHFNFCSHSHSIFEQILKPFERARSRAVSPVLNTILTFHVQNDVDEPDERYACEQSSNKVTNTMQIWAYHSRSQRHQV